MSERAIKRLDPSARAERNGYARGPERPRSGRAIRKTVARGIAAILALLSIVGDSRIVRATSDRPDAEDIVRRWAEGPIRYLLTGKEEETVREITTIPDLARFITWFWKKRDPTPRTLVNEYRQIFWGRVREANRRFQDSGQPGWKGDRGRVFILMGEPLEVESGDVRVAIPDTLNGTNTGERPRAEGEATLAEAGAHEVIRWHYQRARSNVASPEIIVAFVRDETGEWRLSTDPRFIAADYSTASTDPSLDTSFGHPEQRASADRQRALDNMIAMAESSLARSTGGAGNGEPDAGQLARNQMLGDLRGVRAAGDALLEGHRAEMAAAAQAPGQDSALFLNYDLGLEMSLPSTAEMAVTEVSAKDFLSAFTPEPRFEFFRARDGSTFVNIGAVLRESDLTPTPGQGASPGTPPGSPAPPAPARELQLYVRVSSTSGPPFTRFATSESGSGEEHGAETSRQGAIDVWTGLALPPGRYEVTLALEDTGSGRIGRGGSLLDVPDLSGPGLSLSTPILATELSTESGKLAVASRSSGVYHRSESFALYYEVYGLPGGERFTAAYRFFRRTGESWTPIGKPIEQPDRGEGAQGWSFPLEKWPAGHYRLDVRVRPAIGDGKETAQSVEFQVID